MGLVSFVLDLISPQRVVERTETRWQELKEEVEKALPLLLPTPLDPNSRWSIPTKSGASLEVDLGQLVGTEKLAFGFRVVIPGADKELLIGRHIEVSGDGYYQRDWFRYNAGRLIVTMPLGNHPASVRLRLDE